MFKLIHVVNSVNCIVKYFFEINEEKWFRSLPGGKKKLTQQFNFPGGKNFLIMG